MTDRIIGFVIRATLWGCIVVMLIAISGCASVPGAYAEVGVGYQIDDNSDWYVRTEREWQCSDNMQAHFEVGYEWDQGTKLGYHHQSWWTCGGPFNDRSELYVDDIRLTHKFGGR